MKLLARVCIQQSIIEQRIAEAKNSKPVKVDFNKMRLLQDQVDLLRVHDKKDETGWRGPCDSLDISARDNTAIVKHQSVPYIVPLRHVRPHLARALYGFMKQQSVFTHIIYEVKQWPQHVSSDR